MFLLVNQISSNIFWPIKIQMLKVGVRVAMGGGEELVPTNYI